MGCEAGRGCRERDISIQRTIPSSSFFQLPQYSHSLLLNVATVRDASSTCRRCPVQESRSRQPRSFISRHVKSPRTPSFLALLLYPDLLLLFPVLFCPFLSLLFPCSLRPFAWPTRSQSVVHSLHHVAVSNGTAGTRGSTPRSSRVEMRLQCCIVIPLPVVVSSSKGMRG